MSRPAPEVSTMLSALGSDADSRELLFDFVGHKSLCSLANTNQAFLRFTETSRFPRHTTEGRQKAEELHGKARELLHCVLNSNTDANRKRMGELLAESQAPGHQSIILIRVSGQEFYSNAQNQELPRANRIWTDISALQALYKCGDFHFLRRLLDMVPKEQKREALVQLQKAKAECAANIPGSYLYDLTRLSAVYEEGLSSYNNLLNAGNWGEVSRFWACIGEAQKNLPWFLLQVFCNPIPHAPLPDFRVEPSRDCRVRGTITLDLDAIGFTNFPNYLYTTGYALCKLGNGSRAIEHSSLNPWVTEARRDSSAINSLCDVVQQELDQTIVTLSVEVNVLEEQRPQMRLR